MIKLDNASSRDGIMMRASGFVIVGTLVTASQTAWIAVGFDHFTAAGTPSDRHQRFGPQWDGPRIGC